MKVAVIGPGELAAQDVGHSHPADVLSDFRPPGGPDRIRTPSRGSAVNRAGLSVRR